MSAGRDPAVQTGTVSIIGLPFDHQSSFQRGAAGAPPLIRAALFSDASNLWSENGTDLGAPGLLHDAGDLPAAEVSDSSRAIEESIGKLIDRKTMPIALGGDHAITYPAVRSVTRRYPGLSILDFDAHPDLYDEFQGNRYSHACPFARIMEEGLARRLVQAGIRTLNEHQRRQAERFGVEVIEMRSWNGRLPGLDSPLYISVDMDALDPAFAPGTSHREAGGFSVRQILDAIRGLAARVVAADIVEFNPRMDPSGITAAACAKILKEIAAKMLDGM